MISNPYKMKTEVVYDYLKRGIISGKFMAGEKLIVKDISRELNVSFTPVREAINRLEAQGLISITPHVGANVEKIDGNKIEEIYIIRSELESLATRLASKHIKKYDFNKLEKILKEQERSIQSKNYERIGEINKQFHLAILILPCFLWDFFK